MKLRIAFDAGSSACVWAADDEARDALGIPPDLDLLGVRAKLLDEEDALCEAYDEAFPWDDPTAPMT